MNGIQKTMLLIGVFLALMIGTFIWFVATWDAAKEQPVSGRMTLEAIA